MRPKRLRLGTHVIPVSYHVHCIDTDDNETVIGFEDGDEKGNYGLAFSARGYRIAVSERAPDVPTVLLHEAFHEALRMRGGARLVDDDIEECLVQQLAEATVELLRRNKGLAEFLVAGE